jgi:Cytochrome P460
MQPTNNSLQPTVFPSTPLSSKLHIMKSKPVLLVLIAITIVAAFTTYGQSLSPTNTPSYTSDGQLHLPANYRRWVYLTSGFDMSYTASMSMDHHMFDNIFVNPESYQAFLKTGAWPDKTMLVLEVRGAKSKGSINQAGNFQDTEVMGLEVHVKDLSRFHSQGNWAFFGFEATSLPSPAATNANPYAASTAGATSAQPQTPTAKMTPTSTACYSCHAQHAAVDTTFVQFYPTLLPIAQSHATLSPSYLKDPTTPATK